MKHKILYILLFVFSTTIGFVSCQDELPFDNEIIGEGTAKISATVSFHPLISSLDKSRSDGNAIKAINNVRLVIYNSKGLFYDSYELTEIKNHLSIKDDVNTDMPEESNDKSYSKNKAEETTGQAKFDFTLPFGKYYVYVVANYDGEPFTKENAETKEDLLNTYVTWNTDPDQIKNNAQMFGCLAGDNQKDYDDDAPLVTINRNSIPLHAWIKRLASKVTLVFDGNGLKEGIHVYINKVTIHNIPSRCHFGRNNKPTADPAGQLIDDGESLYYNTKGEVSATPIGPINSFEDAKAKCLDIDKATIAGAVVTDDNGKVYQDDKGEVIHREEMPALYFYENCQGDFEDSWPAGTQKEWFNKEQNPDSVGKNITKPGQPDFRDNVPCGTYIEVEAYYTANNNGYLTNGPIKYRFMLGQNIHYDYNALRNRHYKLTLKFKDYANQPSWHIEYHDKDPGLYPPEEFYMSYLYNTYEQMPIRLTGKPKKVTMEIVENNWAPYDEDPSTKEPGYFVPQAEIGSGPLDFKWNLEVYKNSKYYFGLHEIGSSYSMTVDGKNVEVNSSPYKADIIGDDAPEWVNKEITPIWVGFLALQAPSGYDDIATPLPTGICNISGKNFYSNPSTFEGVKNYYYGNDSGEEGRPANSIPLYKNTYIIPENLTQAPASYPSGVNQDKVGRNGFTAQQNTDGSVTIYVPMFTQPKDLGYISGFSGNNPYETFYRKAVVKITAEYDDELIPQIVKYLPVFQMRRIINPKAVWHRWNNNTPFEVKLMVLNSPNAETFENLESNGGEWEAWVAGEGDESVPSNDATFTLGKTRGDDVGAGNKVTGVTGSKIRFFINFHGVGENESRCEKIIVRYHGLTCEHSIYVRQGYNQPIKIGNGAEDKSWSSYSVFSFDDENSLDPNALKPYRNPDDNNKWVFPVSEIDGLTARLTKSPLALGTLFKRGNYYQGVRIINNTADKSGPLAPPGSLELTSGETLNWDDISGIPLLGFPNSFNWGGDYGDPSVWGASYRNSTNDWKWSTFSTDNNNYDIPTIDDFKVLMDQGFGVGVMYTDGASSTAENKNDAFGFFNVGNDLEESEKGMRGFVVYNLHNHNQVFFPIGYAGIGRRTITNLPGGNEAYKGTLRYGSQSVVLSVENNANNQFRPITYNNPAYPGAIYWAKELYLGDGDKNKVAMDMNFFDLTFGPQDNAVSIPHNYGDALPIKPVILDTPPANMPKKKKRR